ncbi:MAG: response regulator [Spirochaetota bacterium]|nr:response regulator [Spirochaetota bacterium]
MKILVVDDSLLLRNIIKNELSFEGYDIVAEAKDGQEAIEKYNSNKPDLVTMDITMDGMNGLDAAEKILQDDPQAKIIMVSALGEDEVMSKAVRIGVKDFIVKPFTPERLINAVKKALS